MPVVRYPHATTPQSSFQGFCSPRSVLVEPAALRRRFADSLFQVRSYILLLLFVSQILNTNSLDSVWFTEKMWEPKKREKKFVALALPFWPKNTGAISLVNIHRIADYIVFSPFLPDFLEAQRRF